MTVSDVVSPSASVAVTVKLWLPGVKLTGLPDATVPAQLDTTGPPGSVHVNDAWTDAFAAYTAPLCGEVIVIAGNAQPIDTDAGVEVLEATPVLPPGA